MARYTKLNVLACHQRRRLVPFTLGLKTQGVYSIACECGWVCNGQTGLSVESHPPWTTISHSGWVYHYREHYNKLRTLKSSPPLHGMYRKGNT